jgi:protein-S-isoprenylcysteine O-methyltransferase Ste14
MSSTSLASGAASAKPESKLARLRAWIFRHRNRLAGLPLIVAFLVAPAPTGLVRYVAAFALVGLGAALRAWCTRYNRFAQGEHKTLATRGPYGWTRNPLYLANTLVLLGCATVAGPLWLVPLTGVWAFLVYEQVVRHEERRLLEKYGAAYQHYREGVPRWLPGFTRALLVQSRALLLLLLFAAKAWVVGL